MPTCSLSYSSLTCLVRRPGRAAISPNSPGSLRFKVSSSLNRPVLTMSPILPAKSLPIPGSSERSCPAASRLLTLRERFDHARGISIGADAEWILLPRYRGDPPFGRISRRFRHCVPASPCSPSRAGLRSRPKRTFVACHNHDFLMQIQGEGKPADGPFRRLLATARIGRTTNRPTCARR